MPLYLECGSADPIVINLISIGLSRLTSIKLKKSKYFTCENPTASNCIKALQNINVNHLDIPEICKQEIKTLDGAIFQTLQVISSCNDSKNKKSFAFDF